MKSALVLLIFVTGLHFCFGQHQPRAFGDIPMDDLKSSSCSFDSSASAAVLFDVVSANLTTSYKYERHIRIKFFKNTSLSDWADANLVFDRTMVKLSKVKGATYNLVNGQVITTELTEQNIFETKINKRLAKVSLMLPQVLAGSIIEYTYTLSAFMDVGLSTLFGSYAGVSFIDLSWEFQRDIPVYWCEYTLTGGSGISYIQGAVALSDSSQQMKKHNTINRWTFKNVPAFQS